MKSATSNPAAADRQPPPPLRVDPELIGNYEDPRAAKKDRAAAEHILRDEATRQIN